MARHCSFSSSSCDGERQRSTMHVVIPFSVMATPHFPEASEESTRVGIKVHFAFETVDTYTRSFLPGGFCVNNTLSYSPRKRHDRKNTRPPSDPSRVKPYHASPPKPYISTQSGPPPCTVAAALCLHSEGKHSCPTSNAPFVCGVP